jgi:predicted flap endonuclease-1-like 5' DNA nuclease
VIWHFFEVWVLVFVAFAVGCPIAAIVYDLLARSPLGGVQAALGDRVGDVVDAIKSRLGVGPVWRPEYRRIIERPETVLNPVRPADDLAEGPFSANPDWQPSPRRASPSDSGDWETANADGDDIERMSVADDGIDDLEGPVLPRVPALPAPGGAVAKRPSALAAPRNGVPDDLQRIAGIGERNERRLNELGIFHFGQIAAWTPAEMLWVAQQLAFPERIERDDWVGQATILASGGETGFVKAADRRRARRQQLRDETDGDVYDDYDEPESATLLEQSGELPEAPEAEAGEESR